MEMNQLTSSFKSILLRTKSIILGLSFGLLGRTESNDQLDFLHFIVKAIDAGYLVHRDFLVCDNACIHGAAATFEVLIGILEMAGIKIMYLPAYSPELNPVELVFMQVKRIL
jgi:transposase